MSGSSVEPFDRAIKLQRDGHAAEAEAAYRVAIDAAPGHAPSAYNNLASLLHARGAHAEAEECWSSAIRIAPQFASAHANLATALLQTGQRRKAWQILRRAVGVAPHASSLYTRMGSIIATSRRRGAGAGLQSLPVEARRAAASIALTAARLAPAEPSSWQNLGLALASLGGNATRAAGRAHRRAIKLDPLSADAHLGLASTQPRDAAVGTLRTAIALTSSGRMRGPSAALYYNLGNLLHHGRHEDGAEDLLEMEFLERDEYSEEELEIAKRVARTWTGSLMLLRPAEAAALSGLEAARHFEQAARLQPSSSDAYYNLALAPQQAHIDVPAKTIAAYAHALRIAPAEPKIWSRYITTLAWAGKAAEARSLADAAVAAGIFERFDQRPALLVRGLQPAPWVDDPERVYAPLVETLKKAHGVFLDTLDYLVSMGHMVPQSEGLQEPGQQWDVFDLGATCGADGSHVFKWVAPACNWYHRLRKVGAQATPPCPPLKVQFSTMDPGLHVRPHTGPTNAKLTLHWGLEVPKGARIRVANETRPFVERGLIAFDDSFEHEVWNRAKTHRTTLVLHVRNPDVPPGVTLPGS